MKKTLRHQPEYVRVRPLAEKYAVSLGLIYKMCNDGRLPAKKVGNRTWLVRIADAERVLGE